MIFIRADANENIGMGHVMRCLSIAHAFAKDGERVVFVTADHRGDRIIQQQKFDTICLNSDWTDLEREALDRVIQDYKPELLLVDSYYVTEAYLSQLNKIVKTAYIDDLNKCCWNVDYLINYNIYAKVFDYTKYEGTKTKLLLSPQYAPLREEFTNCSKHNIKETTDILVSTGGADPELVTEKIIDGICPKFNNVIFHIIVGALNARLENIKKAAGEKYNVILHINTQKISKLMKHCDIAISAAGTTLYELCATGIPTITFTMADNQLDAARQFEVQGIMINAGDCRNSSDFIERLESSIGKIINNEKLRRSFSEKMQTLVDGNGAMRIVENMR